MVDTKDVNSYGDKPATDTSLAGQTADRLRVHASDAADKVKDLGAQATSASHDLKDKAGELLGNAKGMASDAGGKVTGAIEDQKTAGANRVKSISDAIRRAAGELEQELPPAATYIKRAADELDHMADAVQRRDVRQIVSDVQDFAKRQPATFLGAAVLGGFAVMRLLKTPTSSEPASSPSSAPRPHTALVAVPGTTTGSSGGDPGGLSPQAPGFDFKPVNAGPKTGAY